MNFNLDTSDWDPNVPYSEVKSMFAGNVSQSNPAETSFLVVTHDILDRTIHEYVQFMIDEARKYKFELVTVGECLGDPKNNWYRDSTTGQQFGGPPPPPPPPPPPQTTAAVLNSKLPLSVLSSSTVSPSKGAVPAPTASPKPGPATSSKVDSSSSSSSTSQTSGAALPKPNFAGQTLPKSIGGVFLGGLALLAML